MIHVIQKIYSETYNVLNFVHVHVRDLFYVYLNNCDFHLFRLHIYNIYIYIKQQILLSHK